MVGQKKSTKITFLSHASIYVETHEFKLLVDPWLIGSCYWRSWWNYPPVKKGLIKKLVPDAVYITHVHWDHWHGVTLKKIINKDTLIITHEEPNKRSIDDLKKMGFKNIKLIKHGQSLQLNDLKLTIYQFGLFLNDSAMVIENADVKLLNANDCKIAGSALKQITKNHGKFDFALRSHSSANDRILYKLKDDPEFTLDDPGHYARSFKLFMDAVNPKYAIPFASNHCHLHKEVFHFNDYINDPFQLQSQIENDGGLGSIQFKIMLSGDYWSSLEGFVVEDNSHFFKNKQNYIEKYKERKNEILEKYYLKESRTKVSKKILKKFENQIASIPKFSRRKLKDWNFVLVLFNDQDEQRFVVEPYNKLVNPIVIPNQSNGIKSEIFIPKRIFVDAVVLNMFHHSSISKRNKYLFENEDDLKKYMSFMGMLEKVELEVYPLRVSYFWNLLFAYIRRWRELVVYFKAFILLRKGLPIYDVEEEILKTTK